MFEPATYWQASSLRCACGNCEFADNGLPFDTDVVQTKGAIPVIDGDGEVEYLDWIDPDGYPYVSAAYFSGNEEEDCFQQVLDDVSEAKEDWPPVAKPGDLMSCDVCGSSIMAGQPIILASTGRLILPGRRPPGRLVAKFEDSNDGYVLCLDCARMANDLNSSPIWRGRLHEEDCDRDE